MASKKKCRQYREEYLAFCFVESPHDQKQPICLICKNLFSNEAMKPSRVAEHLKRKHPDKVDRTRAYFENLNKTFDQRKTLSAYLKKSSQINESGSTAYYAIAQIIAKTESAQTVAENVIKPSFEIFMKTMLQQDSVYVLKELPLNPQKNRRNVIRCRKPTS